MATLRNSPQQLTHLLSIGPCIANLETAMDRLKALEIFKAIVDHNGFSRGADALSLSRSIATRVVQDLEAELGARLIVRTTRKISLTPFGQCFFERAMAVIGSYEELTSMGKQNSNEACGCVRIDAPAVFGLQRLGGILAMFMNAQSSIDVDLQANDSDVDALSNCADLGISVDRAIPETLIARPLTPLSTGLFASRAYLNKVGMPEHPRDLVAADCMALASRATCGDLELFDSSGRDQFSIPRNGSLRANNADALIGAAIYGAGIVLAPKFLAERQTLVPVLPQWSSKPLDVHLLYRPGRLEPLRVRKLIDFLMGELTEPPSSNTCFNRLSDVFMSPITRPVHVDSLMAA